jgi:hypothetical protein
LIQASTNLKDWEVISTNGGSGSLDLLDRAAANLPRRFYRAVWNATDSPPKLSLKVNSNLGGFNLHADALGTAPYSLEVSSELVNWSGLATNSSGGTMDLTDSPDPRLPCRFYRARLLGTPLAPAQTTALGQTPVTGTLVRVDGAARPYAMQVSTDQVHWTSIQTNYFPGRFQVAVDSSVGGANALSTYLAASRSTFLNSPAEGVQTLSANGIFQVGSWLQLNVTKTNGASVTLAVTNQTSGNTILNLAAQLTNQINSAPELQGADGVVAQDLGSGLFGAATFNLNSRSPGRDAAGIQTRLTGAARLVVNPKSQASLLANLSDLQPRNHLYLTAGAASLGLTFSLDTTALPDGFHELTAVAYEGSSVRTQTRTSLSVQIANSPLAATLTPLDLAAAAPVQGAYHIRVVANTNNVSAIRLFSTGGQLAVISNQSIATFTLNGTGLGAGLHPLYAIVETASGLRCRTSTYWFRLIGGN